MPYMDSVSATRKILGQDPLAKIVVITAVGKTGFEKECLEAGAKKFISKPLKIKELVSVINSVEDMLTPHGSNQRSSRFSILV